MNESGWAVRFLVKKSKVGTVDIFKISSIFPIFYPYTSDIYRYISDIYRYFVKPGKNSIFMKTGKTVICYYSTSGKPVIFLDLG